MRSQWSLGDDLSVFIFQCWSSTDDLQVILELLESISLETLKLGRSLETLSSDLFWSDFPVILLWYSLLWGYSSDTLSCLPVWSLIGHRWCCVWYTFTVLLLLSRIFNSNVPFYLILSSSLYSLMMVRYSPLIHLRGDLLCRLAPLPEVILRVSSSLFQSL